MRAICVIAARSPRDADQMASVLHLVSAIERLANAAVDVAKIVTHKLGIPTALVADLAAAHEISHRVRVRAQSQLDGRSLERSSSRWRRASAWSRSGATVNGSPTPTTTRCSEPATC